MSDSAADVMSSRPLIPQVPSKTLNPDVVQRPLTPPTHRYHGGDDDDDNGDDSKGRWTLDVIAIARFLVIIFTLINFIIQCVSSPRPGILDFLRVFSIIIMVLNIVALVLRFLKNNQKGSKNTTSEVSLVVGSWKFYCWGGDDDVDFDDGISPKKPLYLPGFWLVDILMATILLITSIIGSKSANRYDYRNNYRPEPIFALHLLAVVFEFSIAILEWLDNNIGPVAVIFDFHKGRRNNYQYRIRFPRDKQSKQPISAAA